MTRRRVRELQRLVQHWPEPCARVDAPRCLCWYFHSVNPYLFLFKDNDENVCYLLKAETQTHCSCLKNLLTLYIRFSRKVFFKKENPKVGIRADSLLSILIL